MIGRLLDYLTGRRMTISGESMLPTLRPGDRAVFSVRAYRKGNPERGDIVLIRPPNAPGRLDVKRIVGLPGETVTVAGGAVAINGQRLEEPYLKGPLGQAGPNGDWKPDADAYVVLSDNREAPGVVDSRAYGVVPRGNIIGKLVRTF